MKALLLALTVILSFESVWADPQEPRQSQRRNGPSSGQRQRPNPSVESQRPNHPFPEPQQPLSQTDTSKAEARRKLNELLDGFPEAKLSVSTVKFDKLAQAYQRLSTVKDVDDYIRAVARALILDEAGSSVLTLNNIVNTANSFEKSDLLSKLGGKKHEALVRILDRYTKFLKEDKADSSEATLRLASIEILREYIKEEQELKEAMRELETKQALFNLRPGAQIQINNDTRRGNR